ncbi:MAG: hypothetical protein WBE48_01340 [Xanthobacteraceae bacterium]
MKRRTRAYFVLFSAFAMTMTMTLAVMAPRARAQGYPDGPFI